MYLISKSCVTTEIWEEEVLKSSGSFQRGIPLLGVFPDPLGTARLDCYSCEKGSFTLTDGSAVDSILFHNFCAW